MEKTSLNWGKLYPRIFQVDDGQVNTKDGQKFPRTISSSSIQDTETGLIEFGRSTLSICQIFGYLPLTIVSEGQDKNEQKVSLKFRKRFFSLPFIWAIFLIVLFGFMSFCWYIFFSSTMTKILGLTKSKTERLSSSISFISAKYATLLRRIFSLLYANKIENTWKIFVNSFKEIQRDFHKDIFQTPIFLKISLQMHKTVRRHVAIIVLFLIYFTIAFILQPSKMPSWSWSEEFFHFIIALVWNIASCAHILFIVWLTFPLKIIQGLLQLLTEELDDIEASEKNEIVKWIENYRRTSRIVKLYTQHYEKSLIIEIGYNSIQILCKTFSALFWALGGERYSLAFSRCVTISLSLMILHQLTDEGGYIGELQGILFKRLCKFESRLTDESSRREVNQNKKDWILNFSLIMVYT